MEEEEEEEQEEERDVSRRKGKREEVGGTDSLREGDEDVDRGC
jgi:hypothetical protein